jgi:hypothetical protein
MATARQIKRNMKGINRTRRGVGLPDVVVKERECLKCGHKFLSIGVNNRLCDKKTCKQEGNEFD